MLDMDDFKSRIIESRINSCLEAIENGTVELIEGLHIPVAKTPVDIKKWARRLAADVSGLDD